MKKSLLAIMCAAGLFGATAANAGFYGTIGLGSTLEAEMVGVGDTTQSEFAQSIAVGYKIPILPLKVEIESYRGPIDNTTLNATTLNGYAMLPIPIVSPYVGIGVGKADFMIDGIATYSDEDILQYMIGAELDIPVMPVNLALEYRMQEMTISGVDLNASAILLKTTVSF